jgi:hypothetical protein
VRSCRHPFLHENSRPADAGFTIATGIPVYFCDPTHPSQISRRITEKGKKALLSLLSCPAVFLHMGSAGPAAFLRVPC